MGSGAGPKPRKTVRAVKVRPHDDRPSPTLGPGHGEGLIPEHGMVRSHLQAAFPDRRVPGAPRPAAASRDRVRLGRPDPVQPHDPVMRPWD